MSTGGIDDGFGDDRTEIDYQTYLLDNERLLKLKAAERLRGSGASRDIWDDVLQEGRIVQFEVLRTRPSSTKPYVSAAMSHRLSECISRGTWTGMPTAQGKPRDPLRRSDRDSVDDETGPVAQLVDGESWLQQVLVAYHHGEIIRALNEELTFTQKTYVYRRFWLGMSNPEIAALRGVRPQELERQWRVNIRPVLQERLGHLAGL